MTPVEFKAWFEGFSEGIQKLPTQKQWARIQSRVGEIDGQVTTEGHFVDHYWPPYRHWYFTPAQPSAPNYSYTTWSTGGIGVGMIDNVGVQSTVGVFNSTLAFNDLGKAEALSLTSG